MQVTELKPEWLIEIAPHYYQLKDVEDGIVICFLFRLKYFSWLLIKDRSLRPNRMFLFAATFKKMPKTSAELRCSQL